MININLKNNPDLYKDFEKCLDFLKNLKEEDYEYPEDITLFHTYTEIKNKKELAVITSFLATQNLEKCKLVVWSDYSIEDNPLIQPYKKFIDLKIWNPIEEAKGTILEGKDKILLSRDRKYYLQSDLLRLLVLHKYGGTWIDMDIVFLRDFKPILDQEYMYMWGSETDFKKEGACATVLSLKKNSELSAELLKELIMTPARPETACWGKEMFATLYRRYPFPVFPGTFFNTEWNINVKYGPNSNKQILESWWDKNEKSEKSLFSQAFAWHWHNSSNKQKEVKNGSKFDILNRIHKKEIKAKLGI